MDSVLYKCGFGQKETKKERAPCGIGLFLMGIIEMSPHPMRRMIEAARIKTKVYFIAPHIL